MEKEEKKSKEQLKEMRHMLMEDYKQNVERLKRIPKELKQMEDSERYMTEDVKLRTKENKLKIKDLELVEQNFEVVPGQAKFQWELNPEWLANQKEMLKAKIDIIAQKVKMDRESMVQTRSNIGMQKAEIERQRERCMEAHKVVIKRLREECKVPETELSNLKKLCTSPCCR